MQRKEKERERVSWWDLDGSRGPMFLFMGKEQEVERMYNSSAVAKMEAVSAVIREIDGKAS